MTYDELNNVFPHHSYFYTVNGIQMNEALDRVARLSGQPTQVVTYQGQIVLAVQHELSSEIPWITAVAGNPVADAPAETPADPSPV